MFLDKDRRSGDDESFERTKSMAQKASFGASKKTKRNYQKTSIQTETELKTFIEQIA